MIYEGFGDHRGHIGHDLFFYFLADSLTNLAVFLAKTFLIPREIIPQNLARQV